MAKTPPLVKFVDGSCHIVLGADFSHLYEHDLDDLRIVLLLAESVDPPKLIVDMSQVKFIGSAVIGMFVTASKTLAKRGGTVSLLNPNQLCQTAISLSKLNSLLPMLKRDEAGELVPL
ncbi:MAG: STAS domain-containing protein [Planctomycetaceae bacterium]|nr:STAS domain-containing protein [Planctomycetaceae bacterium]